MLSIGLQTNEAIAREAPVFPFMDLPAGMCVNQGRSKIMGLQCGRASEQCL
jgi:hypothetical protein